MNTYPLTPTTDLQAIAECKYGIGKNVRFTKFTSCLGLFCKIQDSENVIGIHLVLIDGNDQPFTIADIPAVRQLLTGLHAQLDTGWVVGCLDFWDEAVLEALFDLFDDEDQERSLNNGAGIYSAASNGAGVQVAFSE